MRVVRRVWLLCGMLFVVLAGCAGGSASTGEPSSDAIIKTVTDFAGENPDVSYVNVVWKRADKGSTELLRLHIACKPNTRDCLLVAPDGAGYPSLSEFVDDTKLLKPGDMVSGAGGLPSKADTHNAESLTKGENSSREWAVAGGWLAVAIGGPAAVLLIILTVRWMTTRRRNRREDARLFDAWDVPPDTGEIRG